ncbi:uncharacterized protein LOC108336936 [Vigna angularis]|uniref:uncharacterized protein LOC108336936 n=1 Tax=Phaseolus angularis TaxID=3914 RepID=UPI00080A1466|nr:uncharacterized protein LOC108336936 [Vigna angularis]
MKKGVTQHRDDECEKAFIAIKDILTSPPIMSRPAAVSDLQLYIAASNYAVNAALIQETPVFKLIYFSHQVVVRTNHPIAKILRKPDLTCRMVFWSVELSEFGLRFEPRGSVKGQHFGTLTWMVPQTEEVEELALCWKEEAITFRFQTSNNQAEYEALIAGLILAKELALVTSSDFIDVNIVHVPREQNSRADLLSKLTHSKEKTQLSSVIKMMLDKPVVEAFATDVLTPKADWRQNVRELMMRQEQGEKVSTADSKCIARFLCVGEDVYRRGYTTPLLKCLSTEEADYVLRELHNGICGFHSGKHTLRARILRTGYYWPTIDHDYETFVKKCISCQAHRNDFRVPLEELHGIVSPWSFAQWGMDIVGPLPITKAQNKFLLVAIDYFTKWIEAELLAIISAQCIQKFIWHLICRFGLPHKIVTDNGRQFIEKRLEDFLKGLGIKHVTSSVEHPQTNGQAEAANKVILTELKKRVGEAKGLWVEELPEVLWAYRCTRMDPLEKLHSTSHTTQMPCCQSKSKSRR